MKDNKLTYTHHHKYHIFEYSRIKVFYNKKGFVVKYLYNKKRKSGLNNKSIVREYNHFTYDKNNNPIKLQNISYSILEGKYKYTELRILWDENNKMLEYQDNNGNWYNPSILSLPPQETITQPLHNALAKLNEIHKINRFNIDLYQDDLNTKEPLLELIQNNKRWGK